MFGRKKETGRDREAGRAKVSGKNAEKTTGGEKNMETMKKDGQETCPCCDRHCPVDNLHCSKGRRHFGLSDDRDNAERQDRESGAHGRHGDDRTGAEAGAHGRHGDDRSGAEAGAHGRHGDDRTGAEAGAHGRHGDDRNGAEAGAHGKHGGRSHGAGQADESRMTTDEITYSLLRRCGHYLHHSAGDGSPNTMFAVLSEEEKKELNGLLRKVIKSWSEN